MRRRGDVSEEVTAQEAACQLLTGCHLPLLFLTRVMESHGVVHGVSAGLRLVSVFFGPVFGGKACELVYKALGWRFQGTRS